MMWRTGRGSDYKNFDDHPKNLGDNQKYEGQPHWLHWRFSLSLPVLCRAIFPVLSFELDSKKLIPGEFPPLRGDEDISRIKEPRCVTVWGGSRLKLVALYVDFLNQSTE
jgi:hypothetical protein